MGKRVILLFLSLMLCLPGVGLANTGISTDANEGEKTKSHVDTNGAALTNNSVTVIAETGKTNKNLSINHQSETIIHKPGVMNDQTGPVLESYSITPLKATVGDTITITAKVSDETGVSQVIAYLGHATDKTLELEYNRETDVWQAQYKVEAYDHWGLWYLKLGMYDTVGNYTLHDFGDRGKYIEVTNPGSPDGDPPIIQSFTLDPKIIILEDSFTIHVKVTDQTEIEFVKAELSDESSTVTIPFAYNSGQDEWSATYTFPENTPLSVKTLRITAKDKAGNSGHDYKSFMPKSKYADETPPEIPIVNMVTEKDTVVTGEAEPGSTIKVFLRGYYKIGSAVTGSDGKFAVPIAAQEAHSQLLVYAIDQAGNESEAAIVYVQDRTPPAKPIVNEVTDRDDSLTGKAEAGGTVEVRNASQLLGTSSVDINGNFRIWFTWINDTPFQPAGTELMVTAFDREGNASEPTMVVVKDVTPPKGPYVYNVTDKDTSVRGWTDSDATIEVKVNGIIIGTAIAKKKVDFAVPIPLQKAGTELAITATDQAGNKSDTAHITVKDTTPPEKPLVHPITDQDTVVTGEAEPGSTVRVSGSNLEKSTIAGADGTFSVDIPLLEAGTSISVIAWDQSGNRSPAVSVTVKDVTPPDKPVVHEVLDTDTTVKGLVEAYSTVVVKANNKVIGSVDTFHTNDGKISPFTVIIPAQKAGTVLTVTTTDRAGNVSPAATVTVIKTGPSGWVEENGQKYYYDPVTFEKKTGWYQLGRDWYYFHKTTGAMVSGWLKDGTAWYYLNSSGVMATGWVHDGTTWYYLNSSGTMQTGWLKSGSTWYYLNGSGAMKTGWLKSGNTWYYLNSSGAMATGWQMSGSNWYYFNSGGAMQTGWLWNGGAWYYLNSSGAMVIGWAFISGKWYYFKGNGVLQ